MMFRKNKKWTTIHLSVDLKKMEVLDSQLEKIITEKVNTGVLAGSWKKIDILETHVVSSAYQPTRDTTYVELLVFVADVSTTVD